MNSLAQNLWFAAYDSITKQEGLYWLNPLTQQPEKQASFIPESASLDSIGVFPWNNMVESSGSVFGTLLLADTNHWERTPRMFKYEVCTKKLSVYKLPSSYGNWNDTIRSNLSVLKNGDVIGSVVGLWKARSQGGTVQDGGHIWRYSFANDRIEILYKFNKNDSLISPLGEIQVIDNNTIVGVAIKRASNTSTYTERSLYLYKLDLISKQIVAKKLLVADQSWLWEPNYNWIGGIMSNAFGSYISIVRGKQTHNVQGWSNYKMENAVFKIDTSNLTAQVIYADSVNVKSAQWRPSIFDNGGVYNSMFLSDSLLGFRTTGINGTEFRVHYLNLLSNVATVDTLTCGVYHWPLRWPFPNYQKGYPYQYPYYTANNFGRTVAIGKGEVHVQNGGFWLKDSTGHFSLKFKNLKLYTADLLNYSSLAATGFSTHKICDGDTLTVAGKNYYTSGTYTDTLPGSSTCDSIHIRNIQVLPPAVGNSSHKICKGDTLTIGSKKYFSQGSFSDTLQSSTTCDSVHTRLIQVLSIDNKVAASNDTLFATEDSAFFYQWIDCQSGIPLLGETNQHLVVLIPGDYKVEIWKNGCVDTTDCYSYKANTVQAIESEYINVYPNPTDGSFTITGLSKPSLYRILSVSGNLLQANLVEPNQPISMSEYPAGMYIVEVNDGDAIFRKRLIKK